MYNVRSIEVDEESHLVIRIRKDKGEYPVERFIESVLKNRRRLIDKRGPVFFEVSETKRVQITDVYSHAFLNDRLAGLPLDLVLGYFEED